jgi:hypothetical protein
VNERVSADAQIDPIPGGWRLNIGAGPAGKYRLAQLDDYGQTSRTNFPHNLPFYMSLRARAAHGTLPGTWGFGLWNDPFGLSLGFGANPGRLPILPNAAWFFFAHNHNHLSLSDEQPGSGNLVGGYRSPHISSLLLTPCLLVAPFLLWLPAARALRRAANRVVEQALSKVEFDVTLWHDYAMRWTPRGILFEIDGQIIFTSRLSPRGPMGLVVWLDNQYAAWRIDGSLAYGTLATPPDCWVEITHLHVN